MEDIRQQIQTLEDEKLGLQSQLSQGDYKVIKCAEASAAGAEMPYDIEALHAERDAKRARINEIEQLLPELYAQLKEAESQDPMA